jgi:hypothetical protein
MNFEITAGVMKLVTTTRHGIFVACDKNANQVHMNVFLKTPYSTLQPPPPLGPSS